MSQRDVVGARFALWLVCLWLSGCAVAGKSDPPEVAYMPRARAPNPQEVAPVAVPRLRESVAAAGNRALLPEHLRRAFAPSSRFELVSPPHPDEWMARFAEAGQTYDRYVAARPNRPDQLRSTLIIAPLGDWRRSPVSPDMLGEFAQVYFGLPVRVSAAMDPSALNARTRVHHRVTQYESRAILRELKRRLPRDAYALIAIAQFDLYPGDDWNFVFGEASLRDRVAVQSIARYHPAFDNVDIDDVVADDIAKKRALKVIAHEIGHLFGMEHCPYYRCVMNGMLNLRELDGTPHHLCPVCLRKLHHAVGFAPDRRYAQLARWYRAQGLNKQADWVDGRLRSLAAQPR